MKTYKMLAESLLLNEARLMQKDERWIRTQFPDEKIANKLIKTVVANYHYNGPDKNGVIPVDYESLKQAAGAGEIHHEEPDGSYNTNPFWDDVRAGNLVEIHPLGFGITAIFHLRDWYNADKENASKFIMGINPRDRNLFNAIYNAADRYFARIRERKEREDRKREAEELAAEEAALIKDAEVVHTFEDGWKGVRLTTNRLLDREGFLMKHCVGSYAAQVSSGRTRIYSIWDEKNQPHVTIEVGSDEMGLAAIKQVKGPYNGSQNAKQHRSKVMELCNLLTAGNATEFGRADLFKAGIRTMRKGQPFIKLEE